MALAAITQLPGCIGAVGHGLVESARMLKTAAEQIGANPPGAKANLALATELLQTTHGTLDAGSSALKADVGGVLGDLTRANSILGVAPDHCVKAVVTRAQQQLAPHVPTKDAGDVNAFVCTTRLGLVDSAKAHLAELAPAAPATDRAIAKWASDPIAYPVRAGGISASRTIPNYGLEDTAKAAEIGHSVRSSLAEVFGPAVGDVRRNVGKVADTGTDAMPLAGSPPRVFVQEPGAYADRFLGQIHIDGRDERLRSITGYVQSTQFDLKGTQGNGRDISVPIGDYGEPLSRALTSAGRAINQTTLDTLATRHQAMESPNLKLLKDWTFQGPDVVSAMLEGQASTVSMIGTLAATRIPGHTEEQVLDAIIKGDLLGKIQDLPSGITAAFNRSGRVPAGPIEIENGVARFSPQFESMLADIVRERAVGRHPVAATGLGCPVSHLGAETVALTKRFLADERAAAAATAG